jgi:PAS domain S-box-containing protein
LKNNGSFFTEQENIGLTYINKANEVITDFEVNIHKKKGNSLWISTSLLKLEIDNEPCLLIVGIDITERKKATEDLEKQTKR